MHRMRICIPPHVERGVSSAEFAIVLPVFLMLVFVVFGLAIAYFNLFLSAAGVPAGARAAGVQNSAGAGLAEARRIMSVAPLAREASAATAITTSAPGCGRGVYARLSAGPAFSVPLLGEVSVRFRAGSQARNWRFWPGKPADNCE